ncbi:MAG: NUDIX hydrolase [Caldilineaceae bacterium]|nr:NUDIX hydrolase [Caldilineaceae bacterium]
MSQGPFVYCPYCATRLERRERFLRVRPTCPACGFVQFLDPKVAVIGMVTWYDRVLLIRRGVEPMAGSWALPGGYMDAGEMPEAALVRELQEEVGLTVQVQRLLSIYPMAGRGPNSGGIVLAYHALVDGGDSTPPALCCADDAREAAWLRADQLPDDLAFESTVTLLGEWQQNGFGEQSTEA